MTSKNDVAVARLRHSTICHLADRATDVVRTLFWSGASVWFGYFLWQSAAVLAGEDTKISAVLQVIANLSADRAMAYILSFVCTVAFVHEKRLRKKTIAELTGALAEMERRVDPGRTSSVPSLPGKPAPKALKPAEEEG